MLQRLWHGGGLRVNSLVEMAMLYQRGLEALRRVPPGAVMTVGNYDGVHVGHRRLLEECEALASDSPIVAVTFEPHPLTRLRPNLAPPRLTPPAMKAQLLEASGVDVLVELPPDPEILSIKAHEFFDLLANQLRVRHLVEGPDFNFGKGREGNLANLRAWARGTSMDVHAVEERRVVLTNMHVVEVRSSIIRWLVAYGRMRDAAICLGRPYTLRGLIVKGFQRGRLMGMPTANFGEMDQLVPADGVYAGRCTVDGVIYPAAVSIGTLPTFEGTKRQVEAHLLDFDGDLYGQTLDLEITDFVRDQVKFSGMEQLKEKMLRDLEVCRRSAGMDVAVSIATV